MDNVRIAFHLPCGCEFSFRTHSREILLAGLTLDPLILDKSKLHSSSTALSVPSPKWIEINVRRSSCPANQIAQLLICFLVHLLAQLIQPLWIVSIPTLLFSASVFRRFHNSIIEESLLVAADFGIQTRVRFSSGRQSSSRFIPIDCLRGILLMDRVTPFTVTPYLAAELETPTLLRDAVDATENRKPERTLFPLLPTHITHDGKQFSSHVCLPLPTLVFVYRLIYLVCCPTRLASAVESRFPNTQTV
ncbi:unnamed protein product [Dicrocoelium dendriticum]|nr:unnamed protein product [Dicrocoelium dendriticum]